MHYFATLFDINYLSRGLCLAHSLTKVLKEQHHLFVLALDQETINHFSIHPQQQITVIPLSKIEEYYPELILAKNNRNKVEYYFTLSPILPLYILENIPECSRITTVDADLYFYSSPSLIFKEYPEDAVLITPHDFSKGLEASLQYGKFNVSFQSFPNTQNSREILLDWKMKCLNDCSDRMNAETGSFADQKYLDSWELQFNCVNPIELKTSGRAPWNIAETNLTYANNSLSVDGKALIYYHFHHLRVNDKYISHGLETYLLNNPSQAVKKMYIKYIKVLLDKNKTLQQRNDNNLVRKAAAVEKTSLRTLWRKSIGIVVIFNTIHFYNVINLRTLSTKLNRILNGSFN